MDNQVNMDGYKTNVDEVTKSSLKWSKDLLFSGRTQRGYEIDFDARIEWGCAPTEALLLSLAGCIAVDIVSILQKQRVELSKFSVDIEGRRNANPPQFFESILMTLILGGKNIDQTKLDRAIELSQKKYCSVKHSLRSDMEITINTVIE
ncbi:MAG TPA: OsmC family protein [Nitrospinota bacterium]|nr:OsmC family protein [Nitrospinota bacterium]